MKSLILASFLTILISPLLQAENSMEIQQEISLNSWFYSSDAKGIGFRDLTPVAPVGGNLETTLGAQRLNAVATALETWKRYLHVQQGLGVFVKFAKTACSSKQGILAHAGPWSEYRNFEQAPLKETFYPMALANELSGRQISEAPEIMVSFNLMLGTKNCLSDIVWYYGLDEKIPKGAISFYQVALHEIGRGLGFSANVRVNNSIAAEDG